MRARFGECENFCFSLIGLHFFKPFIKKRSLCKVTMYFYLQHAQVKMTKNCRKLYTDIMSQLKTFLGSTIWSRARVISHIFIAILSKFLFFVTLDILSYHSDILFVI